MVAEMVKGNWFSSLHCKVSYETTLKQFRFNWSHVSGRLDLCWRMNGEERWIYLFPVKIRFTTTPCQGLLAADFKSGTIGGCAT